MSSPKVSGAGALGNKAVFIVAGKAYQTGAVAPANAATLTMAQAEALIASGQATPLQDTYLDQYPWTRPPK